MQNYGQAKSDAMVQPNLPNGGPGITRFDKLAPQNAALVARSQQANTKQAAASILGSVTYLMTRPPNYRRWTIADVDRLIMPPLRAGQCRFYHRNGEPFAFVSWAWLTAEAEAGFMDGSLLLVEGDWTGGDRLWIVDLIAPYGGVKTVVSDLKNLFPPQVQEARAARRESDEVVRRVSVFRRGQNPIRPTDGPAISADQTRITEKMRWQFDD